MSLRPHHGAGCEDPETSAKIAQLNTEELRTLVIRLAKILWNRADLDTEIRHAKQCRHWRMAEAAWARYQEAADRHAWRAAEPHYRAWDRHTNAANALFLKRAK